MTTLSVQLLSLSLKQCKTQHCSILIESTCNVAVAVAAVVAGRKEKQSHQANYFEPQCRHIQPAK